jgi:type IV secretion system protein VirB6
MSTWTLFATLYTGLITPLMAQLQAMIGTVCSTMQPIALVMITIWLAFVGADIAFGHKTLPAACKDFAVAACVIVLLQAGQYTQYISNLFLTAVPNTVGTALGGTTSPASGLDQVLNLAWTQAADTYNGLGNFSFKTVGLCIAVVFFLVAAVLSVAYTFLIYMVAAILNVAAVVVGPVFLALAIIPLTRRFAAGWFGVLVGGCATQLMALVIIQLMSGAEINMMRTLFGPVSKTSGNNSFDILAALVQVGVLLGLGGAVTAKIPDVARAIAGGVYHGSAGISAATFGMARGMAHEVTQAAAGGAARGARAVASGATWLAGGPPGSGEGGVPWRTKAPVGRSLSRGDR